MDESLQERILNGVLGFAKIVEIVIRDAGGATLMPVDDFTKTLAGDRVITTRQQCLHLGRELGVRLNAGSQRAPSARHTNPHIYQYAGPALPFTCGVTPAGARSRASYLGRARV